MKASEYRELLERFRRRIVSLLVSWQEAESALAEGHQAAIRLQDQVEADPDLTEREKDELLPERAIMAKHLEVAHAELDPIFKGCTCDQIGHAPGCAAKENATPEEDAENLAEVKEALKEPGGTPYEKVSVRAAIDEAWNEAKLETIDKQAREIEKLQTLIWSLKKSSPE